MIVEYESKQTSIHKLDPRAKFLWLVATIVISIIWTDPVYLLGLGLVTVLIGFMGGFPWAKMKGTFLFLLIITAIITLIQGATYLPRLSGLHTREGSVSLDTGLDSNNRPGIASKNRWAYLRNLHGS